MSAVSPVEDVSALEEERDFLLRSLADLDRERAAGEISDDDYEALRDDYTARAAAALRAIDAGPGRPVASPPPRWSRRRRVVVATAIAGFGVAAGVLVATAAGERDPGGTATGSIRESSVDRLGQARARFNQGDVVGALEAYDEVLSVDPDNREALAYRGFLLVSAGGEAQARLDDLAADDLVANGLSMLDRAVEVDPDYLDARVFRAMARLYVLDDPRAALEDIRVALAGDPPPDMVPRIAAIHQDIESALENGS
jgi:tetratricopeptide (TPR) repeat protein